MPYADPEKHKNCQKFSYAIRYHTREEMREAEARRKAEWYQRPEVKAHRAEMLRKWRERNRAK